MIFVFSAVLQGKLGELWSQTERNKKLLDLNAFFTKLSSVLSEIHWNDSYFSVEKRNYNHDSTGYNSVKVSYHP